MLNWTERIIRMRKEVPEVGWGDFKVISTRDPAVLVIRYDWRNNSVLFVHNMHEQPREVSFASGIPGENGKSLINLLSEDHSHADERGKHTLMLEGYGYRWFRVGGLDYCSSAAISMSTPAARPVIRRDPGLYGTVRVAFRE